jgi:hypothetical protein
MKLIKLSLLGILLASCEHQIAHKVKITYCDGRPSEIGTVYTYSEQEVENRDISTLNLAVPCIGKYLNVCEVQEIK